MYLERFTIPIDGEEDMIRYWVNSNCVRVYNVDEVYPCMIFAPKDFREVNFERVTILYGGNGSGKSTLLNLIAAKLELNRIAPYNDSDLFKSYVRACTYSLGEDDEGFPYRIPNGSRIITSDDIFDYMLAVRTNNEEIRECRDVASDKWAELKFGRTIKFSGMEDYEALRMQVLSRKRSVSRRKFIQETAGVGTRLNSNGETALIYFQRHLCNDTLYCLDEPENSMSPKMQLELVKILEEMARYCGCQFIIATHSPFLLAMNGARIYDLDSNPVTIRNWWELDNTRTYFDFFMKNQSLFSQR